MYNLFLDDERDPKTCATYISNTLIVYYLKMDWIVVRNYDDFTKTILKRGLPTLISFDHDLADEHYNDLFSDENWAKKDHEVVLNTDSYKEKTGYDCALWLVDYCLDNSKRYPQSLVHSQNPVGKKKIESLINNFNKKV